MKEGQPQQVYNFNNSMYKHVLNVTQTQMPNNSVNNHTRL